ncbi:phosphate/phosphite/phosphonate ABC transporter substrate-binding protein [Ignavibacteria bacterium]|nr:phosphate/phosphite/phosphonate ABC transporter substrate-binding protein [Bacteroidota bacterium]MCZ2132452.1 phosphate/phosphite/phosphonate ABC transporter substrate-binding protein [Bacteroidota bacterium]
MKLLIFYLSLLAAVLVKLSIWPIFESSELGGKNNPIKILLTPSVDAQKVSNSAAKLIDFLNKKTGYYFTASFPTSYIAVVEAFGGGKADFAAMNTFSYILAHEKYGVEAKLSVVRRDGEKTYKGQFIARTDSGIDSLYQLNGRKIAYVDPASTSGYILPKAMLDGMHVKPAEEVFAMKHDNVVTMVYQRQVDAGATYYSPPDKATGEILDARARVVRQYPDIYSAVKIIGFTVDIPNDPFVFRKDFPKQTEHKILEALLEFQSTLEGKSALYETYSVEGLVPVADSAYNPLRTMIDSFGGNTEEMLRKK